MADSCDDAAIAEVLAAEAERCQVIERWDWDRLGEIVADEYEYTHSSGRFEDKAGLIAFLKTQHVLPIRDKLTVRIYGDVALMHGTEVKQRLDQPGPELVYGDLIDVLQVWVRRDGSWRLVTTHAVRVPVG